MQSVIETPLFLRRAAAAGLFETDRARIVEHLARNPLVGDVIPGTGGVRKVRFALGERGKSGGCRVVHLFAGVDVPILLLTVYGKGERSNLTQDERVGALQASQTYRRVYREGEAARAARERWSIR